ncbi:transposase [Bradyrhizobium sp. B097]|uniref:transposase n=1 Tax=Bradyrhizobium sp. B097 TaxID=3140244 RepID=UPI003184606F
MIEAVADRLEGAPRQLRRRWSDEFKAQVVTEALEPGASVSNSGSRHRLTTIWAIRSATVGMPRGTNPTVGLRNLDPPH